MYGDVHAPDGANFKIDQVCTGENLQPGRIECADPRRTFSARRRRQHDYASTNSTTSAFQRAARDRILDLRCCGLAKLPDVPQGPQQWKMRVLDARYNWIHTAASLAHDDSLVIINVAHNQLSKLVDSAARCVHCLP